MSSEINRREALLSFALLPMKGAIENPRLKVAIFSKHLQFLKGAEVARAAAEMGFDGVDITVRAGGHVEPARAAEDLPPLVAAIREHKLDVPMITTDIVDATSPNARVVLKTMANLGIRYYRWGGFKYRNGIAIGEQLTQLHQRAADLADLNGDYRVCAMYHTHSGVDLVGAPVWDIVRILNRLDPNLVAINYDVGHATVEGGLGGWIDSFRLAEPQIRGVAVKDFLWKEDERGVWSPSWAPLGEGMVRLPTFFSMLAKSAFHGPLQLHFEYPLGGADAGKRDLTIGREEVFAAMRRDLKRLRTYIDG